MTEYVAEDYAIGSGYAFLGGLPELEGRGNNGFAGFGRIRFLTYCEDNRVVSIVTSELGPGVIGFSRARELDGRHNETTLGLLDPANETIDYTRTTTDTRICPCCYETKANCTPETCRNAQIYDEKRGMRLAMVARSELSVATLEYTLSWIEGMWTLPMGPLEPIICKATCYSSGILFENSLKAVLQNEVASIHPPRSSFRFVKLALEEIDQILTLAEAETPTTTSSFEGKTSSITDSTGSALPSSKKNATHACPDCAACFRRKYDLKTHRASVHDKRRNYKCPQCPKTFTQNGHMNTHIRVEHMGDKQHVCPYCKKNFPIKSKLVRHVQAVHENNRVSKGAEQ
eukprot:CAMPEP_0113966460 /NCGR_PEP_ID=MMETSP0011_2-20120614/8340_1 /TAXON_ID=101924 /ORGANISM="Rhodosorus marinus" /LENGTH=343 /DNA_ID=CAMNT_0000979141 /DNA_START=323 /DNA_END=1354 /DNA_ORIENTATION=+ /assembly_acc=CAM_ASM_000156